MTYKEFIGCACIAFGPAFSMFYWTIAKDPIKIILLIVSSFFWLVSLLCSSIVWFMLPPIVPTPVAVLISILFQEFFRYLVYALFKFSKRGLRHVTDSDAVILVSPHLLSYVSGLGFGLISAAFSLVNILAAIKGPGTVGLKMDGKGAYFCMFSSLFAMCFVFLHTFWSIIFFYAFDTKTRSLIFYVVFSHIFVSSLTLFNANGMYYISLPAALIVVLVSAVMSYTISGGTSKSTAVLFNFKRRSSVESNE